MCYAEHNAKKTISLYGLDQLTLFRQQPRRGQEGTLILCNEGNFVNPYVRMYVRLSVAPFPWPSGASSQVLRRLKPGL